MSDDRAAAGKHPDADPDENAKDEPTKTQDLVKAGRDDVDPDAGTE